MEKTKEEKEGERNDGEVHDEGRLESYEILVKLFWVSLFGKNCSSFLVLRY